MSHDTTSRPPRRLLPELSDLCLLGALLLVLVLCWQGREPPPPGSLRDAARSAVARQLGVESAANAQAPVARLRAATPAPG